MEKTIALVTVGILLLTGAFIVMPESMYQFKYVVVSYMEPVQTELMKTINPMFWTSIAMAITGAAFLGAGLKVSKESDSKEANS